MNRRFLEKMVGYQLTVKAKIKRFGRSNHFPPLLTICLDKPTTKMGVLIDDHIWLNQKDFLGQTPPLESGSTIEFSCEPVQYEDQLGVGYGLGKIRFLKVNDEVIQVRN